MWCKSILKKHKNKQIVQNTGAVCRYMTLYLHKFNRNYKLVFKRNHKSLQTHLWSDNTWGSGWSSFALETLKKDRMVFFLCRCLNKCEAISKTTHSFSSLAGVSGQPILSGRSLKREEKRNEDKRMRDGNRFFSCRHIQVDPWGRGIQ